MKYLKIMGEWIVEALVGAATWLVTTLCIVLVCAMLIVAGYFLLNMNCYVVGDMPMVCNMVDNHGLLRELYDYFTQ